MPESSPFCAIALIGPLVIGDHHVSYLKLGDCSISHLMLTWLASRMAIIMKQSQWERFIVITVFNSILSKSKKGLRITLRPESPPTI